MGRKLTAAILTAMLLMSTTACGSSSGASSTQPSAASEEGTSATPEPITLSDGLSGSCTGSTLIPNNKLSHVDLKTENGNLSISIPKAADLILVDIGYVLTIQPDDGNWTQIRAEYFNNTGEKNVYVTKLGDDVENQQIGTFDVDAAQNNQLELSVPSNLISGTAPVQWNVVLTMNSKQIASCPGDESTATLK